MNDKSVWEIDPLESSLYFGVKHLLVSVKGRFTRFAVSYKRSPYDEQLLVKVEVSSLLSGNKTRDKHLLTEDFFHSAAFPFMTFEATQVFGPSDDLKVIAGTLAIKNKLTPLNVHVEGNKTPAGQVATNYAITASIGRHECGFAYNGTSSEGKPILSDQVQIYGNVKMIRTV